MGIEAGQCSEQIAFENILSNTGHSLDSDE